MTHRPSTDLDVEQVLALLRQVAARDEKAFRTLYESTSRRVYAFVLQRLRDPAAAAEVVSDTFYDVWWRPSAFRGDAKFTTWLLGIARHKLLDRIKSSRHGHEDIDDHEDELASSGPDGFEALAEQQRGEGVRACLDKLGDPHRECLHLVFYEGLSLAEIAALQQVPEGTVKTRLFHARAKIKRCLQSLRAREGGAHV
jgi:RNA polymerase sigma-70 factor, ECF subfamily